MPGEGVGSGTLARRLAGGLGVLAWGATGLAAAGEFGWGAGYRLEYSDNITRVPVNERSDHVSTLFAGFAYNETTTDFLGRVYVRGETRNYHDDVYQDDNAWEVDAAGMWVISPQRFTWVVQDVAREVRVDRTASDTPANRTQSNVFSTGPDVYFHFGPVSTLAIGGRVGDVSVSSSEIDNRWARTYGRWLHRATPLTTLSLNAEITRVMFDNDVVNNDYDRRDFFLRLENRRARLEFNADVGKTIIDPERGEEVDRKLLRLGVARQLTSESTAGITLAREYSTTGDDLLAGVAPLTTTAVAVPPASYPDVLIAEPYYAERAEVFYRRGGSALSVFGRGLWREVDFDGASEDRKEAGARLEMGYNFTGTTSAGIYADYLQTRYVVTGREDDDTTYGVSLGYRLTRTLASSLSLVREERESTAPDREYVNRRALLTLYYSSRPIFTPSPMR